MGAKYPDDSSLRTLPYTQRTVFSLSTNAGGDGAMLLQPSFAYQARVFPDSVTYPSVTNWNAKTFLLPFAGVSQYRIVSAGVRLRNVAPPLTSSGIVRIRGVPTDHNAALLAYDVAAYNAAYAADIPLQDVHDTAIIFQHSARMPQEFYDISGDLPDAHLTQPNGLLPFTVYMEGGPAGSKVLDVEVIIHYELSFSDASGLQQLATPAPPANLQLTAAAATVTSTLRPVFESGVRAAGKWVLNSAVTALASRLGLAGPARLALANIQEVD
jgi:hypothetical protein